MLPKNTFNIVNWKIREEAGMLVLRPTVRNVLMRLFAGTGFFLLLAFGVMGIDYELGKSRERLRQTRDEYAVAQHRAKADAGLRNTRGSAEEARAGVGGGVEMIVKPIPELDARWAQREAKERRWQFLVRGIAGMCVFWALWFPLSPLWQRVRIYREGDELVVRQNVRPRTRRVDVTAVRGAGLGSVAERDMVAGSLATVSHYWTLTLNDGRRTVVLWVGLTGHDNPHTPPAQVRELVEALRRVAA